MEQKKENNLIGFFLLNTASGRTKRRSFPLGTFQDVMQPPNKYISASLQKRDSINLGRGVFTDRKVKFKYGNHASDFEFSRSILFLEIKQIELPSFEFLDKTELSSTSYMLWI